MNSFLSTDSIIIAIHTHTQKTGFVIEELNRNYCNLDKLDCVIDYVIFSLKEIGGEMEIKSEAMTFPLNATIPVLQASKLRSMMYSENM